MIELAAAAAVAGSVAGKVAPKLLDFFEKNHKLRANLEHEINYITRESEMISAAIREDGHRPQMSGNEVHKEWIKMVRDLAYAIDDCTDRFIHRVTMPTDASWIRRKLHRLKTVQARKEFAAAILHLRKTSEDASVLRTRYITSRCECGGGGRSSILESSDEETDTSVAAVGMEAAQDELMELIMVSTTKDELKVISIVGFGGIGKTLLAKHVYNSPAVVGDYPARAWVHAADKDARDVLQEILQQLGVHPTNTSSAGGIAGSSCGHSNIKLCATIKRWLQTTRFFIVIDDMRTEFWRHIKDAFPVVPGVSNRVIVTTTTQSIANACSSTVGDVYLMRTLAAEHSRELFCKEASLEYPPPPDDTQLGSEALRKCDGLPLALVTTAQFLQSRGNPERWAHLCKNLGKHLETNENLARMNRVLVRTYTSLDSQDVKTCLLYLGIYPSGHPIKRASLVRRWLAEKLITEDPKCHILDAAIDNFDVLLNQSIIQPIDASRGNSTEVKEYQTHGMMLEFILHKSVCENFVTLLHNNGSLPSNVRWLSLHNKTASGSKVNPKDLHLVRSLTIFGDAHKSVLDFSKYKLMQVLDLEGCGNHLEDKHLREICNNLLLLRYLSLGAAVTVTVLPKEIKKLQLLETLDLRRTNIEILPKEVMKLPYLIHLFGKFKFQHKVGDRRMHKLHNWLSENSKLETIAGFVVDNKSQGFTQLMEHMKHLTKVKIWSEFTAESNSNLRHLSKAIKEFIERGTHLNEARSLTLNTNDEWSQYLLNFSLKKDYSYYLSSLKLQGNSICSQLPPFVTMLGGLTKLCLSFPGDHKLSDNILDALSRVRSLEYLKLIATQLDKLVIKQGALRSLRCLRVMVEVMTELEIQEGALLRLESLQLLCKDLNGFSSRTIQSLPRLKEVTLHDAVSDESKHELKKAAKNHPRHPKLLFVEMKLMETEPAVEIVPVAIATDTMAEEVDVGSEPAVEISLAAPPTDTTAEEVAVDISPVGPSDITAEEVVVESELAVEISPAAATDTMPKEIDAESEPAVKINPATSPTTTTLSVTTPSDAISTGESVQVDVGSEPAAEISLAAPTDMTAEEVAVETDTMTEEVDAECEPAVKIYPATSPTTTTLSVTTPSDAISTGESVQVDGDCQHDVVDEKEAMDNTEDPKDFSEKNGPRTQAIYQMNKEISIEVMEGAGGLRDQQMEDRNQKRGLENKQRLRARLSSLVAIGVFRRRSRQGRLVHRLGESSPEQC